MARILVTGSADGLGRMAAELLIAQGHTVVAHARSDARARETRAAIAGVDDVIVGDLSVLAQMHAVAARANELGPFDAIIHNAAVGYREERPATTADGGFPLVFAVNTLAPYVLTALIAPPARLVYLSSGLHRSGDPAMNDLLWERKPWSGYQAYADSKLHDALLAFAIARRWPSVLANAVEPGWVATKMGGPSASDDLDQGHRTQVWLAASDDPAARVTSGYFYHQLPRETHPAVTDAGVQDALLAACARYSGVALAPGSAVTSGTLPSRAPTAARTTR